MRIFTFLLMIPFFAFNSCKKDDFRPRNTPNVTPDLSQPCKAKLYDIDITINTSYKFIENYHNPWDYGAPDPESSYDLTIIEGKGIIESLGEFRIIITEYAGTGLNYDAINDFSISQSNYNSLHLYGSCTTNFKKIIKQGGGSFEGNFIISAGSVKNCYPGGFNYHNPLLITGILDEVSKVVTLNIKGKVYF
jgi:hypothetical protein